MPRAELLERLTGKQGLICVISEVIDEALLAARPGLRVVSNIAVGFGGAYFPGEHLGLVLEGFLVGLGFEAANLCIFDDATDVYWSRPEFTRRATLLSTSSDQSHGPDWSSARAT